MSWVNCVSWYIHIMSSSYFQMVHYINAVQSIITHLVSFSGHWWKCYKILTWEPYHPSTKVILEAVKRCRIGADSLSKMDDIWQIRADSLSKMDDIWQTCARSQPRVCAWQELAEICSVISSVVLSTVACLPPTPPPPLALCNNTD